MNSVGIVRLARELGCEKIRVYKDNVMISCPFAPFFHDSIDGVRPGMDRNPSCSIKINDYGPSCYLCFACQNKGTLLGMIFSLRKLGVNIHKDTLSWLFSKEKNNGTGSWGKNNVVAGFFNTLDIISEKNKSQECWDESILDKFKGKVHRYVIDRGFDLDVCSAWEIGWDDEEKRIIFPVRNINKNLVGVIGRVVGDGWPKYKSYFSFKKSSVLYGEDKILEDSDGVVIVEGPFDVLRLWSYGYKSVVAIMGAHISRAQADRILSFGKKVYVMLDWDEAGKAGRRHLFSMLAGRLLLFDVSGPPGKKDPAELKKEEADFYLSKGKIIF